MFAPTRASPGRADQRSQGAPAAGLDERTGGSPSTATSAVSQSGRSLPMRPGRWRRPPISSQSGRVVGRLGDGEAARCRKTASPDFMSEVPQPYRLSADGLCRLPAADGVEVTGQRTRPAVVRAASTAFPLVDPLEVKLFAQRGFHLVGDARPSRDRWDVHQCGGQRDGVAVEIQHVSTVSPPRSAASHPRAAVFWRHAGLRCTNADARARWRPVSRAP